MKKCFFTILFFLGCLFLNFNLDSNLTSAKASVSIEADSYNSRKVIIKLEGLNARTNAIRVDEVLYCNAGEEGCNSDGVKIIPDTMKEHSHPDNITFTSTEFEYLISTESDGDKYFYIQMSGVSYSETMIVEYTLSTLTERIILNPNGQGVATHVYNLVQYSSVRKTNVRITLLEDEKNIEYSGIVYVCEVLGSDNTNCTEFDLYLDSVDYYIRSFGDGTKYLNIYLLYKDKTITDPSKLSAELATKAKLVKKNIYLDTVGPEITIEGGKWVFLEAGQKYEVQNATCVDAVFPDEHYEVTNDAKIVRIDYTSDKYQIVTYEATDKLGNTTSETVKIKVDTTSGDKGLSLYAIIAIGVMAITFTILGYILIKNNEKKKKMSYI